MAINVQMNLMDDSGEYQILWPENKRVTYEVGNFTGDGSNRITIKYTTKFKAITYFSYVKHGGFTSVLSSFNGYNVAKLSDTSQLYYTNFVSPNSIAVNLSIGQLYDTGENWSQADCWFVNDSTGAIGSMRFIGRVTNDTPEFVIYNLTESYIVNTFNLTGATYSYLLIGTVN